MLDHYNIDQIMGRVRALHVRNQRDEMFSAHLDRLLERSSSGDLLPVAKRFTNTGETRGIMVIDGPGGGKSTLVKRGLTRHSALAANDDGSLPYLEANVPSPATLKSMVRDLLKKSGYPITSNRRETWDLVDLLRERMQMLGTSIIWIDEAHDLFCADKNLILRAIKSLMQGESAVIVILSGTERLAEIVRSDPQVRRRFSSIVLPQIDADADREDISAIVEAHCDRAHINPPIETDLVDRLVHAARRRFGLCIEYSSLAVEHALLEGAITLDMQHFAAAWTMQETTNGAGNVFLADDWWNIDPDGLKAVAHENARKRKAK